MKVEPRRPGLPSLISLVVSVGVKQHSTNLLVARPNCSVVNVLLGIYMKYILFKLNQIDSRKGTTCDCACECLLSKYVHG